jgi:dUTP pyrophosphatase
MDSLILGNEKGCGGGGAFLFVQVGRMPVVLRVEIEAADAATFYATGIRNHTTDSGFDLYCPEDLVVPAGATVFVNLGVRCQLEGARHGYYLYPRSSLSKTPLRLANSVGIIDAGYRGVLKAAVDNRSDEEYTIKKGDRLFQVCMPSLEPFEVRFANVDRETERGEGGFGSTDRATHAGERGEQGIGSTDRATYAGERGGMSAAAVAIARGAGLRDPNPPQFNIHYTYFT